ncbi:MAG: DNA polymerase/3'-5' exonuclease PolX [bacterium]|nr:DNA polymerase/3'-5' exonuclease PolX [bacterium]
MLNQKLYKIFYEFAKLLEINGVPFKPAAYEKVARAIEGLIEDVGEIYKKEGEEGIMKISGVGKGIAEKIVEYIKTGRIKDFEKLKKKLPFNVSELTAIEGVGPKLVKVFYDKLKIKNIAELEKAAREGKLARLPRFGEKLQGKILKGIEFRKKIGKRFLLGDVYELAKEIEKRLAGISGVKNVSAAGSFRRGKETVGDLDFLVALNPSANSKDVMDYFISMPEVEHIYGKGDTKSMTRFYNGLDADLRVVEEKSFGAALQYFTGSKEHNVALRKIAIEKGYKLNEYGVFEFLGGQTSKRRSDLRQIAGKKEDEVYKTLGLKFIPPELRENKGEIETALKNSLPELIKLQDIKGDLQMHSRWSDGAHTIREMAEVAKKLGREYIAMTDHTGELRIANGMDEKTILNYMAEIDKINTELEGIKILKGVEVNIKKDGALDISDYVLAKLDIVLASVHSNFKMPRQEMTERICRAMENPNVDIIAHPTGRIISRREGYQIDFNEILACAKRTDTVLEINTYPDRLDLNDAYIKKAVEAGVKLSLGTDSHSKNQLPNMKFGILQARRGWCEKSDIINTLPFEKFIGLFRKPKNKRF